MTSNDAAELAEIMGGKPVDGPTLGAEILHWYREFQDLLIRHAEVISERDMLRRRVGGITRERSGSREAELVRALKAKQHALDFAIRRNEVLKRKAR